MIEQTAKNISPELIEFLRSEIVRARGQHISINTKLEEDLWLYGDEAAEVLDQFSIRFGVNIDEFNFSKYFSKEETWYDCCRKFASFFIPSLQRNKVKKITWTVGDLDKSILTKVLK